MPAFRVQASLAEMMKHRWKLTAQACHLTKKVNNAGALTYLSITIGQDSS